MENDVKTAAIVLAAGKGTRVGGEIPKQYIEVAGKPVLAYCLEAFEKSSIDQVIIVSGEDETDYIEDEIIGPYGFRKVADVVPGGSERYFSVLNGLKTLAEMDGEDTPDYVLIHDGARPYITKDGVEKMILAVSEYDAAVAAEPSKDTVKITDDDGFVISTTDRKVTWQVQTPQAFAFADIYQAYKQIVEPLTEGNGKITDDAMVYEAAFPERKIKLINLEEENSKITTADDLEIMRLRFEK